MALTIKPFTIPKYLLNTIYIKALKLINILWINLKTVSLISAILKEIQSDNANVKGFKKFNANKVSSV